MSWMGVFRLNVSVHLVVATEDPVSEQDSSSRLAKHVESSKVFEL